MVGKGDHWTLVTRGETGKPDAGRIAGARAAPNVDYFAISASPPVNRALAEFRTSGHLQHHLLATCPFAGTVLTNGRKSSGLRVTRQEPHHICSIGRWVFARILERVGQGSSRARSAAGCAVGPTLVTATPQPRW